MIPHIPHPSQLRIKDFEYDLPEDKIAKFPLPERDASKLLIYKENSLHQDTYKNLHKYIPSHSLLLFNETKVVHARLQFLKPTGGKIEVFCLEPDQRYPAPLQAMQETKEVFWKCMVGGAAKWKSDQTLYLTLSLSKQQILQLEVIQVERQGQEFLLKFCWHLEGDSHVPNERVTFAEVLQLAGSLPLPPYLHRKAEESDKIRYQTIFAKHEGSVAAPTAALHFTPSVLESLKRKHVQYSFLTLHVGAGTFKPVKSQFMQGHDMHAEWMEVSIELIEKVIASRKSGEKIIAVGTTSLRTLESLYWIGVRMKKKDWDAANQHVEPGVSQWFPYEPHEKISLLEALEEILAYLKQTKRDHLIAKTQIIIAPGYNFQVIDGLLTNFHQPQSTLLLLVAALIGPGWKSVYNFALNHDFRFLSYGDGCLFWKREEHTENKNG